VALAVYPEASFLLGSVLLCVARTFLSPYLIKASDRTSLLQAAKLQKKQFNIGKTKYYIVVVITYNYLKVFFC